MIKPLRSSDKIVRPFKTFKSWSYKNTDVSDVILLEHLYYSAVEGGMVGEPTIQTKTQIEQQWSEYFSEMEYDIREYSSSGIEYLEVLTTDIDPVVVAKYRGTEISNSLLYESGNGASPETHEIKFGEFDLVVKHGKKIDGVFYPVGHRRYDETKEPINYDGSYQRVVYNTIKHLFYNEYFVKHYDYNSNKELDIKNPHMLFGVESAEYHDPTVLEDIDTGESYTNRRIERRVIGDEIKVLEISRKHFGEKIRPTSVKIVDYSSEFEIINIIDDGYTNLITTEGTFDNVHRVGVTWADRILAYGKPEQLFDPTDFSFGETLSSSGPYFITGCPMEYDELSESQAGSAYLSKYDRISDSFKTIRAFACPFTQNGLSLEQRHDHNNLLLRQIGDVVLSNDYSLNDNFGNAVELTDSYCAIGASRAHIRGESSEAPTGYAFIYERNKGGNDNWGMVNILEGLPGSEFGSSISISDDTMAVGSPGISDGSGVVYIFKRELRTTESSWNRITDVPDGYTWDAESKKFEGYPRDCELEQLNQSTTRWKIKSVIPDGSILNCFTDIGTFEFGDELVSGSMPMSGSMSISGSLPMSECMCDISTFDGEDIISHGTTRETDDEFDAGYEPHKYTKSPAYASGDTNWVLDSYVKLDTPEKCSMFGEEVKLVGNRLYVSTPSSDSQTCYVFERTHTECDSVVWTEVYNITKDGVLDKLSGKYTETPHQDRSLMVSFPYEYSEVEHHSFGKSIDANETYLVIGDPQDREYATDTETYTGGAAYVYRVDGGVEFESKMYGDEKSETRFTTRFGNSVSIFENDILVGAYCTDTSKLELKNSTIYVDDYYAGTNTLADETYYNGPIALNAVEGYAFYYRMVGGEEPTLLKKVKMNKKKSSIRRQYAYSVSLSSDYMYVGLPVIGNFPYSELSTFDGHDLAAECESKENPHESKAREALFMYYGKFNEVDWESDNRDLSGNVIAYRTDSVREMKNHQVGNIFYKNGVVVITDVRNHLKNILSGSHNDGYEIEFAGTHTLYETEILCTVEPNEFNMSTNPTSVVSEDIIYDVNGDGKFDILDLIIIYKYLKGHTGSSYVLNEVVSDEEVPGGLSVEQDTMWPNSDILLTESDDAILMFFERESDNLSVEEYNKTLPILRKLKDNGDFDVNNDGTSGSADAKLIIRYFKGNTGQDLTRGLITKNSKRRVSVDIVDFLDKRTGKSNGVEILPEFERFTDLNRLISCGKTMDALHPYVTTIGLYSGLDLVGVAKLAKPTKITPSYPINFLIKYDG